MCGYANSNGGTIYIGVDDDGNVVGINNARELLERIPNKITDMMGIIVDVNLLHKDEQEYRKQHSNYEFIENTSPAFRNIRIYIHEKKWVMVSKNKTPAIHFLIRHPKMRSTFENMMILIIE